MILHLQDVRRRSKTDCLIAVAVVGLASGACGNDGSAGSRNELPPTALSVHYAAVDESVWERAPNQPRAARAVEARDLTKMSDTEVEALREEAENDPTWRAVDGTRYETMMYAAGRFYGRKGPAPIAPKPHESNRYGSSGEISKEGLRALMEVAPQGEKTRITTDFTPDDRLRQSSTTVLTTYPFRMIGPIHFSGATGAAQDGGCTAVKIGPRQLLTAAHCVLSPTGVWTTSGRWNPGQSATTAHNGNFAWNWASARDWRIGRQWDYAVIAVDDGTAIAAIPWQGVTWWDTASSYNNKSTNLAGYPCGGANTVCGQPTQQRCKWSPEADRRCNGWVYSHNATLLTAHIQSDDQMQMPQDCSTGQSGSSLWWVSGGSVLSLGVWAHSPADDICRGPRFRQNMWDDVCNWIALTPSAHATHSLCF